MFWFFGPKAYGILAPQPGIKPAPFALEGEISTTGPQGKSLERENKQTNVHGRIRESY